MQCADSHDYQFSSAIPLDDDRFDLHRSHLWPARLGTYFVMSSTTRDYPLVLGITILWAVLISITNFLTDVLYGVIDPRVRITEGSR